MSGRRGRRRRLGTELDATFERLQRGIDRELGIGGEVIGKVGDFHGGKTLVGDEPRQFDLSARLLDTPEMLRLGHGQLFVADELLDFVGQVEEAQVAPDCARRNAHNLADARVQIALRKRAVASRPLLAQPAEAASLLHIVQVTALNILDQLLHKQVGIIRLENDTGHLFQAELLGRAQTAAAVDDAKALTAQGNYRQRLEEALVTNGLGKVGEVTYIVAHALGVEFDLLWVEVHQLHRYEAILLRIRHGLKLLDQFVLQESRL